jgi:hypothetical protein
VKRDKDNTKKRKAKSKLEENVSYQAAGRTGRRYKALGLNVNLLRQHVAAERNTPV